MDRMRLLAGMAVVTFSLATGCNKKASTPVVDSQSKYTQDAVAAGGTLNSDGSVTNANGTVTEPSGTVLPANANQANSNRTNANQANANGPGVQTVANSPAPAPAPSNNSSSPSTTPAPIEREAPVVRTAPAGTSVTIRTNETISSKGDEDGQHFSGVLERPVVSHGTVVFERGTPVSGEVVSEKNKGTFKGAGELGVVLTAIGRVPVHTSEYVLVNKGRGKRTGAFIGGGGGLGALIGGIAGGGKGALIGGLAGAGAGTAASTTGSKNVVIRSESVITFRLREAVSR
jgi:hypothetical protein